MSESEKGSSNKERQSSGPWGSLFGGESTSKSIEQLLKSWTSLGANPAPGFDVNEVLKSWTSGPGSRMPFGQWLSESVTGILSGGAPPAGLDAFLASPLQLWGTQLGKLGGDYGALWASLPPPSTWFGMNELPPLGLNREWETKLRAWRLAVKQALAAHAELERHYAQIYRAALSRLMESINEPVADAPPISTVSELYDLWVAIAEESYHTHVMTEPYAQAFGAFINATARAQQTWHALYDDMQAAMNLPNRREIDALVARQSALAADLEALTARDSRTSLITSLQREVALLRQQVEELSSSDRARHEQPGAVTVASRSKRKPKAKPEPENAASNGSKKKRGRAKRSARAAANVAGEFDIGNFD